ncbi:hypothetical protein [Rickettsiella endosymbiont of Rhagonycha lignosa]|uniref:hypothetical protein n=1 Tax=Rickettsiella endosymbiont of Rhagonycha lignosa TaxID=3077937 RepID=UPI00313D45E4
MYKNNSPHSFFENPEADEDLDKIFDGILREYLRKLKGLFHPNFREGQSETHKAIKILLQVELPLGNNLRSLETTAHGLFANMNNCSGLSARKLSREGRKKLMADVSELTKELLRVLSGNTFSVEAVETFDFLRPKEIQKICDNIKLSGDAFYEKAVDFLHSEKMQEIVREYIGVEVDPNYIDAAIARAAATQIG